MEVLKDLGSAFQRGWQDLAEGWRDIVQRGSSALTRFFPRKDAQPTQALSFPRWGMLAGEVVDRGSSVVVQVELPGVERDDCQVTVQDGYLRIRGERRSEREHLGASYYLMERAYGSFERAVRLPPEVDEGSADARLRDGVLRVEFKKKKGAASQRRRIDVG
jgi:HSP20 family protein